MKRKETPRQVGDQVRQSQIDLVAKRLASLATLAKKAAQAESKSEAFGLQALLGQLITGLRSLEAFIEPLQVVQTETLANTDRLILELEANLRKACDERGWRLEGVWPSLYVERGVEIVIDDKKRIAMVGRRRIPSLAISEILLALTPLIPELIPKDFDPKEFFSELVAAYDETKAASRQVPIFDVYRSLIIRGQGSRFWRDAQSSTFSAMSADQFRARFSRMLETNALTTPDGRRLRLLPPLNPEEGLYMYQPAESRFGYVGRLELLPTAGEQ